MADKPKATKIKDEKDIDKFIEEVEKAILTDKNQFIQIFDGEDALLSQIPAYQMAIDQKSNLSTIKNTICAYMGKDKGIKVMMVSGNKVEAYKVQQNTPPKKMENITLEGIAEKLQKTLNEGHGYIDAYGVKGMQSKRWRRVFKNREALEKWVEDNDAEVLGTADVEDNYTRPGPVITEDDDEGSDTEYHRFNEHLGSSINDAYRSEMNQKRLETKVKTSGTRRTSTHFIKYIDEDHSAYIGFVGIREALERADIKAEDTEVTITVPIEMI
jgi:hypothetical protein